jgi:hypothetical protein
LLARLIEHKERSDRKRFRRQVDEATIVRAQFRMAEETKFPIRANIRDHFVSYRDVATASLPSKTNHHDDSRRD